MIYAKCIRESQIAHSENEFKQRQNEGNTVYCEGQTSVGKYTGTLCCVPLNMIFNCLKYGGYIAIIEYEDDSAYEYHSSHLNHTVSMSQQKVLKIMPAYSFEAIDFVFAKVGDPALVVESGYTSNMPEPYRSYFYAKKNA